MTLALLALAWMLGIIATDRLHIEECLCWQLPVIGAHLDLCRKSMLLWGLALIGASSSVLTWHLRWLRMVGLCLCVAALGGLRYQAAQVKQTAYSIAQWAERGEVLVQGIVSEEPRHTEEGQRLVLSTELITISTISIQSTGLLLVTLPPYPVYRYGQRLVLDGRIELPPEADRPNAFDYRDYLARKGIFVMMREPAALAVGAETVGNPILTWLLTLRNHCYSLLLRAMPEPEASVAAGMLLGLKASIPDEVYATFSATGTSHILVVSGWNLSIVAFALIGQDQRFRLKRAGGATAYGGVRMLGLGRFGTFCVAQVAIWLYALFMGATPTVMRAATMASLTVLAVTTEDRRTEPWTLLLVACWLLSFLDPQVLWDLGFQLSALATASLFAFGQPVEHWLRRCYPLNWAGLAWFTEALTATLAAQILALPLILYHFGNLSLIAPLANVVIVPIVPYAMLVGTMALVVNWVALPTIGWVPSSIFPVYLLWMVAWLPFAFITEAARYMAAIPWAAVTLPPFPLWMLLTYYAVIGGGWWLRWGRKVVG